MLRLTRDQAEQFMRTLYPKGSLDYVDNPTRTFLSALIGDVPHGLTFRHHIDKADSRKRVEVAAVLRSIAGHLERDDAGRTALADRDAPSTGGGNA